MSKHPVQLSKYLSFLLRHGADEVGLALNEEGFAKLDDVWKLVEERYKQRFTRDHLDIVLAGDDSGKKRFELVGEEIRAMYGHNRKIQAIQYQNEEPPMYLYHGTTPTAWPKIQAGGLLPMERQYVHLAIERQRAQSVASRYTKDPIMLRVRAKEAYEAGVPFYHPETSHYLTETVPAAFVEVAPDEVGG